MENQRPKERRILAGDLLNSAAAAIRSLPKALRWGTGILAALVLALFIASYFLDEPLRRSMEKEMNGYLKGYFIRLPKLHGQLVGLSLTLNGLTVYQQAAPDPPIAHFPVIRVGIHAK